jgi:glycine hydroxymethyltransferase
MGLDLAAGGHLTHGIAGQHESGKWFNAGALRRAATATTSSSTWTNWSNASRIEHKPKLIIAGGSAYPRIIDFKRASARSPTSIGAYLFMVDMAHFAGLVAGGVRTRRPFRPRPCRDHHHPQDAARPARRHDPDQ